MSAQFDLEYLGEDHRPYPGRHRRSEPVGAPVAPPAWAIEHSRSYPHLVGEGPTAKIRSQQWRTPANLPLPARARGAALKAGRSSRPWNATLGRALQALRVWR